MTKLVVTSAFRTTDGLLIEGHEAAAAHQAELDLKAQYEDNRLLGNYAGSSVNFSDLAEWLRDNRGLVLKFLEASR